LVLVGIALAWPPGPKARMWLFVAIIQLASAAALIRLHATGGYCSPRHAMVVSFLMIPAAAFALHRIMSAVWLPGTWLGLGEGRFHAGPAIWALVLAGFAAFYGKAMFAPVNAGFGAYRTAGKWVAGHVPAGEPVVDVTGWILYYGQHSGYTFANLHESLADRDKMRWVLARVAHIEGPWDYCKQLRQLVGSRDPVAVFPPDPQRGEAQVFLYDLQASATAAKPEPQVLQPALNTPQNPRR
jgi:hypothetical protein